MRLTSGRWRVLVGLAVLTGLLIAGVTAREAGPVGSILVYGRVVPPEVFAGARRVLALPALPLGQWVSEDLPRAAVLRLYTADLVPGGQETRAVLDLGRSAPVFEGLALCDATLSALGPLRRQLPGVPIKWLALYTGHHVFILGQVDPAARNTIGVVELRNAAAHQLTQGRPAGGIVDSRTGLFALEVLPFQVNDSAAQLTVGSLDLVRIITLRVHGRFTLQDNHRVISIAPPQALAVIRLPPPGCER